MKNHAEAQATKNSQGEAPRLADVERQGVQGTAQHGCHVLAEGSAVADGDWVGGMSGGGFAGMHEGTPYGRHSFSYWDDKALVQQTLQSFDGHELEITERLSISEDRKKLSCILELSSGGRTIRYTDDFPI